MTFAKRIIDNSVIQSLLLMVILAVFMFIASLTIMDLAKSSCYKTLENASEELTKVVVRDVNDNSSELKLLASCLSRVSAYNEDEIRLALSAFQKHGLTSALGVLLPDGTMVYCGPEHDTTATDESLLSGLYFSTEKVKAPYISSLQISEDGYKYIYRAVPIRSDEGVSGILYSFISPDRLVDYYRDGSFWDSSAVSIIESTSGKYIINGIGDVNDSFYNDDILQSEVAAGASIKAMYKDIANGDAGHIAFRMNESEDFLYTYYMPIGISNWVVILSVDRGTAFADALHARFLLDVFGVVFGVILLVYFVIVLSRARRHTARKERQLSQTVNMFEVQQILLGANKTPDAIREAMQRTAEILKAESVFIVSLDGSLIKEICFWGEEVSLPLANLKGLDIYTVLPDSAPMLMKGENVIYSDKENVNISELGALSITNAIFVPVTDTGKNVLGVLGGINAECMLVNPDFLESIARNFLMALSNVESYRKIREMGSIDALTGLKNRHCYQTTLDDYSKKLGYACTCVYLDVNGLHELNNTKGHTTGDEMLRFVAHSMADTFDSNNVYRIGGDEFVALCRGLSQSDAEDKVRELVETVKENGYEVAVGIAYDALPESLVGLVAYAEKEMYADKDRYYKSKGIGSKAR